MFEELINKSGKWINSKGPDSDVVISSRVRLARNIGGFVFPQLLRDQDYEKIFAQVKKAAAKSKALKNAHIVSINQLDDIDRYLLVERHLISYDHAAADRKRAVIFSKDESISVMVNEEDHLRMQVILPGIQLQECWRKLDTLDTELERELAFAFSPEAGYLTACPTNTGTGLRASMMVHLPALVISKDINKILQRMNQLGLVVRGFYGEGIEIRTAFFQISNQISLSQTESEIIVNIERITRQIMENEHKARASLFKTNKAKIEDNIWRAYGLLKSARTISFEEAITLLSSLRLGAETGIIKVKLKTINELLISAQPGHIQRISGKPMPEEARDIKRAELIRNKLRD